MNLEKILDLLEDWNRTRQKRKNWLQWAKKVSKDDTTLHLITIDLINKGVLDSELANAIVKGNRKKIQSWIKSFEESFRNYVISNNKEALGFIEMEKENIDKYIEMEGGKLVN